MENFFTIKFWFDVYPHPFNSLVLWLILGLFVLVLLIGFFGLSREKKLLNDKIGRMVWSKIITWSFTFGVVGFIIMFLKQQRTPYLGMRIWLSLWLLLGLAWLVYIIIYLKREVPKIREEKRQSAEFKKYLPK